MIRFSVSSFIVVFILLTTSACSNKQNDFDVACIIYEEASSMTTDDEARAKYIEEEFYKRINTPKVIQAYSAIANVEPQESYKLFKMAAEMTLNKPWDCKAMEMLMNK